MLIDEQLNQHVARLTPSSGTSGFGNLFYLLEISISDMSLDGIFRKLKTLADDFLIRVVM